MYLDIGWTYGGVVSDFVQFSEHEEHHQDSPWSVVVVSSTHSVYLLTGICTPLYVHPMSRYVPACDEVCLPFPVLVVLVSMYVYCYTV